MAASAKTIVDSLREIAQDILVPEVKALRTSVDSLRTEMHLRTDSLQKELQLRDEMLRAELKLRDESLKAEIRSGDAETQEMVRSLGQKLDFAIDIRERRAALEARLPRQ